MSNESKFYLTVITLFFAIGLLVACAPNVSTDVVEEEYTESVQIAVGADTLTLTAVYFSDKEEASLLYSELADGYIYSGVYEDVESLIFWIQEYPILSETDVQFSKLYYQDLIEEKIW
tara:strand:+ start:56 stop:409 length:354 start_codon:yes stop_codon:yes gene_type:complete